MNATEDTSFAPLAWEGPAIGLMDLDAFFASVEELDHPEWRGKPIIVGGSAERRGVVSTASYEARKYGVHSAMPSYQAKRLCPHAIWTHGHYARYREMSDQVMAIILDETPLLEQVSIDEAFFDVTPGRYSKESPLDICRRIQRRVAELGITCSIGLGVNKTVAKIASERQKPRGLTVVLPGMEGSFLAPLPVRSMSGIGKATESRLTELGIRTLGDLARQDPKRMEQVFGVFGPRMVARAAGQERSRVRAVDEPDEVKSVSNERTFAKDLTTKDEMRAAIDHVSALVGTRLRRKGLTGSQVTLKLKFDYQHTHTAQRQLPHRTDDEHIFGAVAQDLLKQIWSEGTPVRLVGVAVSSFDHDLGEQLSLFADTVQDAPEDTSQPNVPLRDLRKLSVTTDEVRKRFGSDALSYGRDLRFKDGTSDTMPTGKFDSQ
ncbi:MAG: DNA polymerase IV [Coriobacteriales bacterium]|nr:DNA polymerase IV [Coriobacteriales bacterium]